MQSWVINKFERIFMVVVAVFVSGIVAKIVYALFVLALPVLVGSKFETLGKLMLFFGIVASIATWIGCFMWLHQYFKKEYFKKPHNKKPGADGM